MPSQVEYLKESLARLEPEFGPDNAHVKGLKAQIAMHEKPRAENPMSNFSAGTRSSAPPTEEGQMPEEMEERASRQRWTVGRNKALADRATKDSPPKSRSTKS